MIYALDRIVQDVRICLDMNRTSDALFTDGDEETLRLDEVIKSKVVEAVDTVHRDAPYWLLEQGHNFGDELYWLDKESGFVKLPADFMRLVVFEMSDWDKAVYSVIRADDVHYIQQRSRVKGIRGTSERPVCVFGMRPEGRVLEFYSCKSRAATVSKGVYIPYASIDIGNGVDISELCYKAVVYTIGGLVLMVRGEADMSALMMNMAKKNMEI